MSDMVVSLRIRADGTAAATVMNGVRNDLARVNASARTASQGLERMGSSLKNFAAGLVGVAALKSMASEFMRVNIETDKLRASLKTATGSLEAAGVAWKDMADFAAKTPYAVNEVVEAFIRLKNLGLDPSREALTAYGNISASMGKSLMQFAEAVADAVTGEFERLKEFGIKASKEGEQVTFTFRDVATTVGNSSKEIEGYLRSLGNVQFSGAMDDQMQTVGASVDRLKERWEAAWRAMGDQGGTQGVKTFLDTIGGYVDDAGEQWGKVFAGMRNSSMGLGFVNFDSDKAELEAINQQIKDVTAEATELKDKFMRGKDIPGAQSDTYKKQASEKVQELNALESRRLEIVQKIQATSMADYNARIAAQKKIQEQSDLTYHEAKALPKVDLSPKLDKVDSELAANVTAMIAKAAEDGVTLGITSGFRSTEKQAQLWAEALKKYGSATLARQYVAPPGKSNHEKGDAVDVSYLASEAKKAQDWLDKNALTFNVKFPVKTEGPGDNMGFVHAELASTGKSRANEERDAETLATKKLNEEKRKQNELERETAALYEATRTPVEALNNEIYRLDQLLKDKAIDQELYTRGVAMAQDDFAASSAQMQNALERTMDPAKALEQVIIGLNAAYQAGDISMAAYVKAVNAAQEAFGQAAPAADKLRTAAERMQEASEQMGQSMAQAFEDAILGAGTLQDILQALLRDIARIIMQKAVTEPLGNFLGDFFGNLFKNGFASGGVMTPAGPMPLLSYASGGIATTPQLALFGEGSMNEAYVPLPDGRNIPVVLKSDKGEPTPLKITVNNLPGQDSRISQDSSGGLTIETVRASLATDMHHGGVPWVGAMERRYGMSRGRV